MKKIVYGLFFGDSITYGEYDGVFGGWVDILKDMPFKNFMKEMETN
jgi:lysophospholipase L1-like esterase